LSSSAYVKWAQAIQIHLLSTGNVFAFKQARINNVLEICQRSKQAKMPELRRMKHLLRHGKRARKTQRRSRRKKNQSRRENSQVGTGLNFFGEYEKEAFFSVQE